MMLEIRRHWKGQRNGRGQTGGWPSLISLDEMSPEALRIVHKDPWYRTNAPRQLIVIAKEIDFVRTYSTTAPELVAAVTKR